MKLFDTHAHLGDAKFDAPSEHYGTLREEYLARAFGEDGVGCVLTAGTTVQSSRRELDFALSHEHALTRVVAGVVTLTQMGLLGALIAFAPRPLYTPHLVTAPIWNLTALEDQQLGGLIMWIPASAVFLVAALITAYSVLRESEHAATSEHS